MAVITSEMVLWKDLLLLTDMYFLLQLEEEGPSTGGFHDLVLLTARYGGGRTLCLLQRTPLMSPHSHGPRGAGADGGAAGDLVYGLCSAKSLTVKSSKASGHISTVLTEGIGRRTPL